MGRNISGPKTDPCGTSTLTFFQLDEFPLKTTRCGLSLKRILEGKEVNHLIPLRLSLLRSPLCLTLSNAFGKSRNAP